MPDPAAISQYIQQQIRMKQLAQATAVEAAQWLDSAGILRNSPSRPGKPLRDLLRAKRITGVDRTVLFGIEKRRMAPLPA